jgi:uncharacterized protein YecT (DUF1311 family)
MLYSANSLAVVKITDIKEVNECQQRHQDRIDYSRCLDQVLGQYERNHQSWQNDIIFKLQDTENGFNRSDAVQIFKSSIKAWESYKNKHCQWQYIALLPDVASASIVVKECQIVTTVQSIENLKEVSAFEF